MLINVGLYDKFKQKMMPAGDSKYKGFNQFWRRSAAALCGAGVTLLFTYPFELLFTRITADLNTKKQGRLYQNTFDCFNATQIEGGIRRLYRGSIVAFAS